jgi:hypothetical protein
MMIKRDICRAIHEFVADRGRAPEVDLEEYLRRLLGVIRALRERAGLTAEEFVSTLQQAFTAEPVPFDREWAVSYADDVEHLDALTKCEATLIRQVVDLREMREAGTLQNEWRYFGVDAPRGERWFNFDPHGYLECAAAGVAGVWEAGESLISFADSDTRGKLLPIPQHAQQVAVPSGMVTWSDFADFLYCGQIYE